ncbi:MAG: chemotaxis protein [Alphaproteobacteria bacterium]|nr:chemotaxis protein [Alphaproteobacteria bacterium]MBM3652994.1 chemotaxis protein [Alphaproteobacteria bacterium]
MKLLFRSYLASLREREELDAILPDLLSELGFHVYSRPQRGTAQAGVDIAAVGKDEDGERKLFLFSVKQGDLTRQSWDGTPQALRSSLNEILDSYVPTKIPKRYQDLKILICLVFGGDMQEQVRGAVSGYIKKHSTTKISFDEWNGDKLAGLLLQGILREEIMPKALRSYFQKAVALVDEPDIAYQHFARLAYELIKGANDEKSRVRTARQLYIALWVLFVWARDVDNVEAPYRASELVLLNIWNLLRRYIGKKSSAAGKAITAVLRHAIQLHLTIACELLERKILPHVGTQDGISMAIRTHSSVDVNLKLFDVLGRIALTGLWLYWIIERDPDATCKAATQDQVARLASMGYQLINNNRALFLPLHDQQAIEIALFLVLAVALNENDARTWLHEMVERIAFTVRTHGRYPCVFTEYRDLVAHPRERTDDYLKEATSGSILIPLVAAFLSALDNLEALERLVDLKAKELQHCTLQLWIPDESSEEGIYVGAHNHGVALCDLPLSATGSELLKTVRDACNQSKDFNNLSAIATGYWPIILTACRHFRLPVPPQFWIKIVDSSPNS